MAEILTVKNLAKTINNLLQKLEQSEFLSDKELEIMALILIYHQLDLTIGGKNTFYAIKQANKYITKYMSEFTESEKPETGNVYKIILNRLYQMHDESTLDDSEFNEKYEKNLDSSAVNEVEKNNDEDLLNQVNSILNSNIGNNSGNPPDNDLDNDHNDEENDEDDGGLLI